MDHHRSNAASPHAQRQGGAQCHEDRCKADTEGYDEEHPKRDPVAAPRH